MAMAMAAAHTQIKMVHMTARPLLCPGCLLVALTAVSMLVLMAAMVILLCCRGLSICREVKGSRYMSLDASRSKKLIAVQVR